MSDSDTSQLAATGKRHKGIPVYEDFSVTRQNVEAAVKRHSIMNVRVDEILTTHHGKRPYLRWTLGLISGNKVVAVVRQNRRGVVTFYFEDSQRFRDQKPEICPRSAD